MQTFCASPLTGALATFPPPAPALPASAEPDHPVSDGQTANLPWVVRPGHRQPHFIGFYRQHHRDPRKPRPVDKLTMRDPASPIRHRAAPCHRGRRQSQRGCFPKRRGVRHCLEPPAFCLDVSEPARHVEFAKHRGGGAEVLESVLRLDRTVIHPPQSRMAAGD